MYRTFRAACYSTEDGQGQIRLTSEAEQHLSDEQLKAAANREARDTLLFPDVITEAEFWRGLTVDDWTE